SQDVNQNGVPDECEGFTCVPACNGACMSLKAVAINNSPISPNNCIHARSGDTITSEIKISGWGDEMPLGVRGYEVYLRGREGVTSGSKGTLLPVGWQAPLDGINYTSCNTNSDCPPQYPLCNFHWAFPFCTGLSHNPDLGAFIDTNRPD